MNLRIFTQRDSEDLTQRSNGLSDDPIEAISRSGNVVSVYSLRNTSAGTAYFQKVSNDTRFGNHDLHAAYLVFTLIHKSLPLAR